MLQIDIHVHNAGAVQTFRHLLDQWLPIASREFSLMYEWIKALHVIAIIAWMAGMLYLPRLFVYHCEAETGSKQSETFKVMERRLAEGDHQPGDDCDLARRALSGLGRPLVFGRLVSRKAAAGAAAVRRPRLFFPLG